MGAVHIIDHPLVQHKLTFIRNKATGPKDFRELVNEVSMLMAYEVTRDLPLESVEVETPVTWARGQLVTRKVGVVAILRAGLGMVEGILKLMPTAGVGHIGLQRDQESLRPVEYYWKLPGDLENSEVIVVDPMLATGGSAAAAIGLIKRNGGRKIRMMNLIAAPEGIKLLQRAHPDVDIFTAAVDLRLNEHGYIVPGLGDAGDRLFGTR
jgi:uracil phosphoribosyltransferase